MKTILISGFLVILALWLGFSLGYHDGMRDGRDEFLSMAHDQNGNAVILVGKSKSHVPPYVNSIPHQITTN